MRKSSMKVKGVSLFTKIFLMFIIFILPLYLFSKQIITSGKNDVRKEIVEASNSNLTLYLNTLENEFLNIIRFQTRVMSNMNLSDLSKNSDFDGLFDTARSIINLQGELQQIKDLSQYVDSAIVLLPSLNMQITNESIGEIANNNLDYYMSLVNQKAFPFTYDDNHIFIVLSPFFLNSKLEELAKPAYIICVSISQDKINAALTDFFNWNNGGAVFIGDKYGLNIQDNSRNDILSELRPLINNESYVEYYNGTKTINVDNKKFIVSFRKSMILNSTLFVYQPEEHLMSNLVRYKMWLWIMSSLTVVIVIMFSIWIKNMIVKPLNRLMSAFDSLDDGDINLSVGYNSNDEFGYLYKKFNRMCNKFSILVKQVYEEKLNARSAELKQLQYQINPHFLYNCFFLIYRLAKMDDIDNVIRLTQHLGSYYQFITKGSSDEVPLIREIKHAQDYIVIQTLRFSNRITAEIKELPQEFESIMVPRLIMQPIIENAYIHGLKDKLSEGFIQIDFEKQHDLFIIGIENNGELITELTLNEIRQKLDMEKGNIEYTGLINVHRRLKLKFGTESGIKIYPGKLGGLRVEICLKIKQ